VKGFVNGQQVALASHEVLGRTIAHPRQALRLDRRRLREPRADALEERLPRLGVIIVQGNGKGLPPGQRRGHDLTQLTLAQDRQPGARRILSNQILGLAGSSPLNPAATRRSYSRWAMARSVEA
jgi:hypothetical protein